MLGKATDLLMRKEPFNEDNERRGRVDKDNKSWYDKAVVLKLPFNAAFQNEEEQVSHFYDAIKAYLLDKNTKNLLISGMYSGMNSHKLVKILEKDDAEYWKMLKSVDASVEKMVSLDQVLCDEGIKMLMPGILKEEFSKPSDDMNEELKSDFYKSGCFPLEIESMFARD